jgi:hypothetical protein
MVDDIEVILQASKTKEVYENTIRSARKEIMLMTPVPRILSYYFLITLTLTLPRFQ